MKPFVLLAALALAGCSDIPRARTEKEIQEIARRENMDLFLKVNTQAIEIQTLRTRIETLERQQIAFSQKSAGNGRKWQETRTKAEALAIMTAAGMCGKRNVTRTNNGMRSYGVENIPCTAADLPK